jgi:hypothetical protein
MYRGHCAVLGMQLHQAGVPIVFVPSARTIHRFPDSARELLKLRMLRGRDTCELGPQVVRSAIDDEKWIPHPVRQIVASKGLPSLGPLLPLAVLAARFGYSVRAINRQDMPPSHGLRRLGCIGAIAAITAADMVGALAGGLGLMRAAPHAALSYHGDGDRLAA